MTATIHRIHDICAAEAREANACHTSELRIQAAHDILIEVPEMRATIKHTRRQSRIIAGCMVIIFAALIGAVMLESAWTASIAASLAE